MYLRIYLRFLFYSLFSKIRNHKREYHNYIHYTTFGRKLQVNSAILGIFTPFVTVFRSGGIYVQKSPAGGASFRRLRGFPYKSHSAGQPVLFTLADISARQSSPKHRPAVSKPQQPAQAPFRSALRQPPTQEYSKMW